MSLIFNRKIELEASSVKAGSSLTFTDLRVGFAVNKTVESNANTGRIDIYNLSASSRAFCENPDLKVRLKVGYGEATEILFVGGLGKDGVGKAVSERQGPDWLTRLELGDGIQELDKTQINKTFSKGTPVASIVSDVVSAFGLDKGAQIFDGFELSKAATTVTGKAKNALDKLAGRLGFDWSVQDEAIQIVPKNTPVPAEAVLVSAASGLLSNVVKTADGIEFTSFILPGLVPGRACIVQSDSVAGSFKILKAAFTGDNWDGPWEVKVEAKPL